jgi:hypothetical protein
MASTGPIKWQLDLSIGLNPNAKLAKVLPFKPVNTQQEAS